MRKKELQALRKEYGLGTKLPTVKWMKPALIEKYRGKTEEKPEAILRSIAVYNRFKPARGAARAADWSLDQIIGMYFTASANGASFEQVDASCNENYGMTFGTMIAIWQVFQL